MRTLSKNKRKALIEYEIRRVTQIFVKHMHGADNLIRGVSAIEEHWRTVRHSPVARWIRFYVVGWSAQLLASAGRLEVALAKCNELWSLPASTNARLNAVCTQASLLRRLGRLSDSLKCCISGLRICKRTGDLKVASSLLVEVARMNDPASLEKVASEFGPLVKQALAVYGTASNLDSGTPLSRLMSLQQALGQDESTAESAPDTGTVGSMVLG